MIPGSIRINIVTVEQLRQFENGIVSYPKLKNKIPILYIV